MWALNINEDKKLIILKLSDTLTLNELSELGYPGSSSELSG
jgi:hypothetical protein